MADGKRASGKDYGIYRAVCHAERGRWLLVFHHDLPAIIPILRGKHGIYSCTNS